MNQSAEIEKAEHPPIQIGQIYVSSVAFEHREDALQLSPKTEIRNLPFTVGLELGLEQGDKRGIIRLILATRDEEKPLYRLRVEMTALVEQTEESGLMTARDYLITSGAFMLYPFMREFIANLTARGRFGPIWIRPLNFRALADQLQMRMSKPPETGTIG